MLSKFGYRQIKSLQLFVHIPKTAGTSFRASLEKSQNVVCDYGEKSEHTSPVVNNCIYQNSDAYSLKAALADEDSWLCGHVHLSKYLGLIPPQDIVTFVREPTARVVSHFNHELRWGKSPIQESDFFSSARAMNYQHRFLQGLPLSLIGFVGITEQYAKSLALLDKEMSVTVEEAKFNQNDQKVSEIEDLDETLLSSIKEQNALDNDLYESAKQLLAQRMMMAEKGLPWTYIHAEVSSRNLVGIAYRRAGNEPVELSLTVNGEEKGTLVACELTSLFPQAKFPRDRFVGFSYRLTRNFNKDDVVELSVRDTEQGYSIKL